MDLGITCSWIDPLEQDASDLLGQGGAQRCAATSVLELRGRGLVRRANLDAVHQDGVDRPPTTVESNHRPRLEFESVARRDASQLVLPLADLDLSGRERKVGPDPSLPLVLSEFATRAVSVVDGMALEDIGLDEPIARSSTTPSPPPPCSTGSYTARSSSPSTATATACAPTNSRPPTYGRGSTATLRDYRARSTPGLTWGNSVSDSGEIRRASSRIGECRVQHEGIAGSGRVVSGG